MDKPIFEIIEKNNCYKIYENGMIEGFGEEAVVIHRIPLKILAEAVPNPTNPRHQHDP